MYILPSSFWRKINLVSLTNTILWLLRLLAIEITIIYLSISVLVHILPWLVICIQPGGTEYGQQLKSQNLKYPRCVEKFLFNKKMRI